MSDRETLEFAAKAAGKTKARYVKFWKCIADPAEDGDGFDRLTCWNPLADDGDAFKLMVQLRLGTLFPTEIGRDRVNVKGHTESLALNDPLAATRRAIVRAAAEIGRQMP